LSNIKVLNNNLNNQARGATTEAFNLSCSFGSRAAAVAAFATLKA
jgi:hypothetical protein